MENYFNYFTEIEECFRKRRGTPTLLSTLDWALIESWKESGIPLEAVLTGIERAFQKFAKRPQRFRKVNGLGYCSQSVFEAAEELETAGREGASPRKDENPPAAAFTGEEVARYLERNAALLEEAARQSNAQPEIGVASDLQQAARSVRALLPPDPDKLQELEQMLSALEEKLAASATRAAPADLMARFLEDIDRGLAPYRRNMNAPQIELVRRQSLKKRLFEHYRMPRLSLFYYL